MLSNFLTTSRAWWYKNAAKEITSVLLPVNLWYKFVSAQVSSKMLTLLHLQFLQPWENLDQINPRNPGWRRGELWSFRLKTIRPRVFVRTRVCSPYDIQHSTTWWTYLSRGYFSYPWISHMQSLSFHGYSLFSSLQYDKCPSGELT